MSALDDVAEDWRCCLLNAGVAESVADACRDAYIKAAPGGWMAWGDPAIQALYDGWLDD